MLSKEKSNIMNKNQPKSWNQIQGFEKYYNYKKLIFQPIGLSTVAFNFNSSDTIIFLHEVGPYTTGSVKQASSINPHQSQK